MRLTSRLDDLLSAQAARLAPLVGPELVAASRSGAAHTGGDVLDVGGVVGVVEVVDHPEHAMERVVLGDTTVFLHVVALPEPGDPGAVPAVTEWLAAAAALAGRRPGRRVQFFLRWPAADTAIRPVLVGAGLRVDALWSVRQGTDVPPGSSEVLTRPAMPGDAARVSELAVEEMRYHLPLTPFSRDLPVLTEWAVRRVLEPDPAHPVLVVERDGVVDGYAVCRVLDTPDDGLVRLAPPGRTGHLQSVGVTALARGHGVGGALVAAAAARLSAVGATRLSAGFVPGNPTAEPFWRARGFVPRWSLWAGVVG